MRSPEDLEARDQALDQIWRMAEYRETDRGQARDLLATIVSLDEGGEEETSFASRALAAVEAEADLQAIVREVDARDLDVNLNRSRLSEAIYLEIYREEAEEEEDLLTIRIAGHEARPTYDRDHDLEIGGHGHGIGHMDTRRAQRAVRKALDDLIAAGANA